MNDNYHWVKPETISDSVIYKPLQAMTDAVFPYLVKAKEKIFDETPSQEETKRRRRKPDRHNGAQDMETGIVTESTGSRYIILTPDGDGWRRGCEAAAPEREPHDKSVAVGDRVL